MSPLTRRRLEWLVRARGTDLSAWPVRERTAALELLRRSPEAQLAFADALVADGDCATDCAVLTRMQAALRRSLAPLSLLMRGLRAGALVACVGAGLYMGTSQDLAQDQASSQADPESLSDPFASAQTLSLASLDQ